MIGKEQFISHHFTIIHHHLYTLHVSLALYHAPTSPFHSSNSSRPTEPFLNQSYTRPAWVYLCVCERESGRVVGRGLSGVQETNQSSISEPLLVSSVTLQC